MKFNKKQRIGILVLLVVIVSIQTVILNYDKVQHFSISQEKKVQLAYYNALIDSLKGVSSKKEKTYFNFNPNKLSYNSWSFFGLSNSQLYSLDSFRVKNVFSSKQQVKRVLKLNDSIFGIVEPLMYFPKKYLASTNSPKNKIKYADFNPNKNSKDDWINFGFSEKQSEVIYNYISAKGGLQSKEELKDIFVISDEKYSELSPFAKIPKEIISEKPRVVSLNTATVEDFQTIKGIGEVYSKIIVDYRSNLGGFKYYYQLKETKVVDSMLYELIKKEFALDKEFVVSKISVNTATFEELKNHPYIGWRFANSIVDFRTNFRNFKSLDELKNIEVISDAYFNKIELYLALD